MTLDYERRGYVSGFAIQRVIQTFVTDEALQAAYDARFKDAKPATEYNAAHILVATEEEATKLKADLAGGADFAELAKANSTDTGSGANGGDLGWFRKGMMVAPFENAVAAMTAGTVSDPVKTDFGWHIIKLNEVRDAAKPTLDDVREELASEIEQKAVEDQITKVTAEATVTRPGEGIDPAVLRDATILDK